MLSADPWGSTICSPRLCSRWPSLLLIPAGGWWGRKCAESHFSCPLCSRTPVLLLPCHCKTSRGCQVRNFCGCLQTWWHHFHSKISSTHLACLDAAGPRLKHCRFQNKTFYTPTGRCRLLPGQKGCNEQWPSTRPPCKTENNPLFEPYLKLNILQVHGGHFIEFEPLKRVAPPCAVKQNERRWGIIAIYILYTQLWNLNQFWNTKLGC